jgi:hypothetical protein
MADHDATNDYGPLDPRIYVESITLLAAICPDLSSDQTRHIAGILADSRLSPDARLVGVMATELAGPKMDRDVTTGELADALAETADHPDALLRDPAFVESIEAAECAGLLPMPTPDEVQQHMARWRKQLAFDIAQHPDLVRKAKKIGVELDIDDPEPRASSH